MKGGLLELKSKDIRKGGEEGEDEGLLVGAEEDGNEEGWRRGRG